MVEIEGGERRTARGCRSGRDATRIDDDKGILDQVLDWTLCGDLRNRVLAIVLVGLVLYGTTIALDGLVLRPYFGDAISEPTDLDFYRFRADSILDGKIPYVDFYSESPP